MALYAAIGVSGGRSPERRFYDNRQGHELEWHGAAVQLDRELKVGSVVKVKNQPGMQVSAGNRGATVRTAGILYLHYRIPG
jgi:hypothetical protein